MKTTLSMPSTTSIALKAMKLAQTCGSVSQSVNIAQNFEGLRLGGGARPLELIAQGSGAVHGQRRRQRASGGATERITPMPMR